MLGKQLRRPGECACGAVQCTVSAGGWHTCGLRKTGAVECWGYNRYGQTDAPTGRFSAVSAGAGAIAAVCARRARVECWGCQLRDGETDAPPETLQRGQRRSGGTACGLRETGAVECWGRQRLQPNGGADGALQRGQCGLAGTVAVCATSGAVECWGGNDDGQTDAPAGQFSAISAGQFHTCALRKTGAVECWGNDRYGRADRTVGAIQRGRRRWRSAELRAARDGRGRVLGRQPTMAEADAPSGQFSAAQRG